MTEQEAFEDYIHLAPYDYQKTWAAACAWQREELAKQQRRKCEAGPSLQDLWDCWDAVHGGQKPVAYMKQWPPGRWEQCSENYAGACPVYLHPTPIPEGWQLVPKEPTKDMSDVFWSAYIPAPDGIAQSCSFEDFHDFRYMYKAMLAAAPKPEELK